MSDTRAHPEPCPILVLPTDLSEEAADALLRLLQELLRLIETHYGAPRRGENPFPGADRQLPLWPEQGPPF